MPQEFQDEEKRPEAQVDEILPQGGGQGAHGGHDAGLWRQAQRAGALRPGALQQDAGGHVARQRGAGPARARLLQAPHGGQPGAPAGQGEAHRGRAGPPAAEAAREREEEARGHGGQRGGHRGRGDCRPRGKEEGRQGVWRGAEEGPRQGRRRGRGGGAAVCLCGGDGGRVEGTTKKETKEQRKKEDAFSHCSGLRGICLGLCWEAILFPGDFESFFYMSTALAFSFLPSRQ